MLRSPSAPAIASIVLAACGATDEADDEHGPGPLPDPASCVPPSYEDAATGNPGPDVAADVGLDKQLFIDDFIVARAAGVTRVPGRVDKLNNAEPVLVANEVWEAPIRVGFYLSVHWDDRIGKFRMWYLAQMPGHSDLTDEHEASHTGVGYAESSDGVTWSKPLVGRRYSELTPGAPDVPTNVVHQGHGFNVLDDPTLPAGHPQKLKAAYDDGTTAATTAVTWPRRTSPTRATASHGRATTTVFTSSIAPPTPPTRSSGTMPATPI